VTPAERFYTGKGDDGTTGLLYGGRTSKGSPVIEANGAIDEAQAAIGLARASAPRHGELDELLVHVERDLWIMMAEMATAPENRRKLQAGQTLVTEEMVGWVSSATDDLSGRFAMPHEFVIPGQDRLSAELDVARTVVRRAERLAVGVAAPGSWMIPYLNRLSSLLWAAARWQEGEALLSRPRED